ncbi:nascent polypeptide-associated complex subunit alpha, muscle-specific form-like [Lutra lutra]|uniref:nascent polypeptide-associated complex subunit alpha, muscle-specific form-like n=1 Tax=Lutra lutra TaxID=9657 RepID=UPI001FD3D81E|nr:nascent polypeptide-associated complex subunit alpha, muscle-specific form-like [Lutra lutra]
MVPQAFPQRAPPPPGKLSGGQGGCHVPGPALGPACRCPRSEPRAPRPTPPRPAHTPGRAVTWPSGHRARRARKRRRPRSRLPPAQRLGPGAGRPGRTGGLPAAASATPILPRPPQSPARHPEPATAPLSPLSPLICTPGDRCIPETPKTTLWSSGQAQRPELRVVRGAPGPPRGSHGNRKRLPSDEASAKTRSPDYRTGATERPARGVGPEATNCWVNTPLGFTLSFPGGKLDRLATPRYHGGHGGSGSEGWWMNLGPGLVCHPPPGVLPSPQQEQQRERLAEGAYFGSVSLATAAAAVCGGFSIVLRALCTGRQGLYGTKEA